MTTSIPLDPSSQHRPPAGRYPTGRAGIARDWDGVAWSPSSVVDPDAPQFDSRRSFGAMLRRLPVWLLLVGVIVGFGVTSVGGLLGNALLLGLGGALVCAGPIAALTLGVHRRLGLRSIGLGAATIAGLIAGVVAIALAFVLDSLLRAPNGNAQPIGLAMSGPIEESAKLLVPFALLLFAGRRFSDPRIGVWMVLLSASVFGMVEGVLYTTHLVHGSTAATITTGEPGVRDAVALALQRGVIEVGHPLFTVAAAAIIWLAAHRAGRAFTWIGLAAFAIAAGVHSFNDEGLTLIESAVPALAIVFNSPVLLVVLYFVWFRPRVRATVPPDVVADVPKRWRPTPPKPAPAG